MTQDHFDSNNTFAHWDLNLISFVNPNGYIQKGNSSALEKFKIIQCEKQKKWHLLAYKSCLRSRRVVLVLQAKNPQQRQAKGYLMPQSNPPQEQFPILCVHTARRFLHQARNCLRCKGILYVYVFSDIL